MQLNEMKFREIINTIEAPVQRPVFNGLYCYNFVFTDSYDGRFSEICVVRVIYYRPTYIVFVSKSILP
jgi:hypothetical protein